jgi:hypothetical protein
LIYDAIRGDLRTRRAQKAKYKDRKDLEEKQVVCGLGGLRGSKRA